MKQALIGFVIGVVAASWLGFELLGRETAEPVVFDQMWMWKTADFARIEGAVTGEGLGPLTNSFNRWDCDRNSMTCRVDGVRELGHNHVKLDDVDIVPVTEWGERTITIDTETGDSQQCNYYIIVADFETKTASYTRMPKSDEGMCSGLEQRIFNWRIDDALFWQDEN